MLNIAVLVSGGGTNLQALINAQQAGEIPDGKIACVIASKPGVYALERAASADIPAVVCSRADYPDTEAFDSALVAIMDEYGIDLIVLAGYLSILSPAITAKYANRIINIHPSLIPSFCGKGFYGLRVHEAVLEKGVKVTGATVHFVNEIPDGGAIIAQKAVEVLHGDTPEILQRRVMEQAEWSLLPYVVAQFCARKIRVTNNIAEIVEE